MSLLPDHSFQHFKGWQVNNLNNRVNNNARAFFTICNNNGENHSASCSVIKMLKQFNHHAFLLKSLADGRLMRRRTEMIALFDSDCVGDSWIESDKRAPGTPSWAYELSTGPCIIICHECVASPSHVVNAVRKIAKMFSRKSREHNQYNQQEHYPRLTLSLKEYHERPRARTLPHRDLRHFKQF